MFLILWSSISDPVINLICLCLFDRNPPYTTLLAEFSSHFKGGEIIGNIFGVIIRLFSLISLYLSLNSNITLSLVLIVVTSWNKSYGGSKNHFIK